MTVFVVMVMVALLFTGYLYLVAVKNGGVGAQAPTPPKFTINRKWVAWGVGATLLLITTGLILWFGRTVFQVLAQDTITTPIGGAVLLIGGLVGYLYWKGGIKRLIPVGITVLVVVGVGLVGWWGYQNLDLTSATVGTTAPQNPLERLQAVGQDFVPGLWTTVTLLEQDVVVLGVPIAAYWILMAMVGTLVIGWGKGAFHDWFLALLYSIVLIFASQALSNILLGTIEPRTNVLAVVVGVGYFLACAFAVRKFSVMGLVLVAALSWPVLLVLSLA